MTFEQKLEVHLEAEGGAGKGAWWQELGEMSTNDIKLERILAR